MGELRLLERKKKEILDTQQFKLEKKTYRESS